MYSTEEGLKYNDMTATRKNFYCNETQKITKTWSSKIISTTCSVHKWKHDISYARV